LFSATASAYKIVIQKQVALYYGQSYRFNKNLYHTVDFSYEYYYSTCTDGGFFGLGMRMDFLQENNYSIGFRYFRTCMKRPSYVTLYWGISPVYFQQDHSWGINLKPEIGYRVSLFAEKLFGINLNFSYGYEIPVLSKNEFSVGRNDLSVRLAGTINLWKLSKRNKYQTE